MEDYVSNMSPRADSAQNVTITHSTLKPDDIIIAVMGITGVGKTTFVNLFSDCKLPVGHGLDSCTQTVDVAPCSLDDGTKFFLVDTPGFDDSTRSDSDILREIALWLTEAHESNIKLAGIVFLHRISDVRVPGSGIRMINTFQKLCGEQSLGGVVLATTMWDFTTEEAGNNREAELKDRPQLWKPMVELGSRVIRQDRGRESALNIVKYLVERKMPLTLEIQHEMVDLKLELLQTGAGSELASALEKMVQVYERKFKEMEKQLKEALDKKNQERQEILEASMKSYQAHIQKAQEEIAELRITREELVEEARKDAERRYEQEIQQVGKRHAHELEQQRNLAIKQVRENFRKGIQCMVM